jgi:hypothetical protein
MGSTLLLDRVEEVANRLGLADDGNGQPHAEGALDPQNQFGAAETVNSKIAFDTARQRRLVKLRALRVQLTCQPGYDID